MTAATDSDIKVNIDSGGVSIRLPRLTFEISERQAERLRNVLNAALPRTAAEAAKQRTSHYLLSIAGDVEPELSEPFATDQERLEAAQDYRRAHGDEDGLYRLDLNHGSHVAPITLDTFRGWELAMPKPAAANIKWVSDAWIEGRNATVHENAAGRFELHVYETRNGSPTLAGKGKFPHYGRAERAGSIWTRTGEWDLTEAVRGCTLCRCEATGEVCGLPVCDYHADHTEDDPRCPHCAGKHTCERCDSRNAEHVVRDVALCDRCNNVVQSVAIGDRVRDPLDGTWREIVGIDGLADGGSCHMADGGCMSLDECAAAEKRLPSEELPS